MGYLALATNEAPVHLANTSTRSLPGSFLVSPQGSPSKNVDDHEDGLEDEFEDESTLDGYAENENDTSDILSPTRSSLEPTPVPTTSALSSPPSSFSIGDSSGYSSAFNSQRTTPVAIHRHSRGHHQTVARTTWKNHVHPLKKQVLCSFPVETLQSQRTSTILTGEWLALKSSTT